MIVLDVVCKVCVRYGASREVVKKSTLARKKLVSRKASKTDYFLYCFRL